MLVTLVLVLVTQTPARVPLTPHAAKPLQLGVQCLKDSTCGPALFCAPEPHAVPSCHLRCTEGCSDTQRCTVLAPPDDARRPVEARRFVCTDNRDLLCESCESDADCGLFLDKCIAQLNGEKACGRDCAWDDQCPAGYRCGDPGDADGSLARRQCIPRVGCCHCDVGYEEPRAPVAASGVSSSPSYGGSSTFSTPAPVYVSPSPQPWWANPGMQGWSGRSPVFHSTPMQMPTPSFIHAPAPTPSPSPASRGGWSSPRAPSPTPTPTPTPRPSPAPRPHRVD